MKWLSIFTLIFSLNTYSAPIEKEWRIVIENNYKRSKKIWGTYGLTSERSSITNKKKSKTHRRNPEANMMLKNGKMVMIHPTSKNGKTSYKVKSFPYKRKPGKSYQIELQEQKEMFLEIYKEQIMVILRRNKVDTDLIDWKSIELDKMSCLSKRVNFNCKIPLLIKVKNNS
jgi:hypothetical protein